MAGTRQKDGTSKATTVSPQTFMGAPDPRLIVQSSSLAFIATQLSWHPIGLLSTPLAPRDVSKGGSYETKENHMA